MTVRRLASPYHDTKRATVQGLAVTVNLIPWNPVLSPDMHFKAPGHDRVRSRTLAIFSTYRGVYFMNASRATETPEATDCHHGDIHLAPPFRVSRDEHSTNTCAAPRNCAPVLQEFAVLRYQPFICAATLQPESTWLWLFSDV